MSGCSNTAKTPLCLFRQIGLLFGVLSLALGVCSAANLIQPDEYVARSFTTSDGLAQNSTTSVDQSADGRLWIGHLRGLSSFDGSEFTNYSENVPPGMPHYCVSCLAITADQSVWLGTTHGIYRLLPSRQKVVLEMGEKRRASCLMAMGEEIVASGSDWLAYGKAGDLRKLEPTFVVQALAGVADSPLWVGTSDALYRVSRPFSNSPWPKHLTGQREGRLVTHRRSVWMSLDGDLVEMDVHTGDVVHRWPALHLGPLMADREGRIWLCNQQSTVRGFVKISDGTVWLFPVGEEPIKKLAGAGFEDASGALWMPRMALGITALRRSPVQVFGKESGLPSTNAFSIHFSEDGGRWFMTDRGTARWVDGRFEAVPSLHFGSKSGLLSLGPDAAWVGSDAIWRVSPGAESVEFDPHKAGGLYFSRDRSGRVLALGKGMIWRQEAAGQWLPVTPVPTTEALLRWDEGADGEVFLSTMGGGLFHRPPDGAWRKVALPGDPRNVAVYWMEEGRRPWVGSDKGMFRRRDDGGWDAWTHKHGMAEDIVGSIQPDQNGGLWLLGYQGIHRVTVSNLLAVARGEARRVLPRTLGVLDGLDGLEGNVGPIASAREPDGTLWFATSGGFVRFHPEKLPPPFVPQPEILDAHDMSAGPTSMPISTTDRVVFTDGRGRHLRLRFTALYPSEGSRARIQYRLEGLDQDWYDADHHRMATYVGLAPGDYRFRVRAAYAQSGWHPQVAEWSFVVRPLWWERTSVRILLALALMGGVAWRVQRLLRFHRELARLRQDRAVEDERRRLAQDMHDGIGSELARIHLAAVSGPVDAASASRSLLDRLQTLVWLTDPAEDRIEAVARLMADRLERFFPQDSPRVHVDILQVRAADAVDGRARRELLAWLDEGLANIAKHAQAQNVRLEIRLADQALHLMLSDDGVGFSPQDIRQGGRGLSHLHARIQALGGTLEIQTARGQGTRLHAILPWPLPPPARG